MEKRILGVFAKQPRAGQVKTRLAKDLGAGFALRLAEAMLLDTLDQGALASVDRVIVHAPAHAADYFARAAAGRFTLKPQADGDLGSRLKAFVTAARHEGYSRIVLVGSDCPILPGGLIMAAFDRLGKDDAVIGPARDGGYYLIGLGARDYPIFDGIPWSTERVAIETRRRLDEASAATLMLPELFDIDTPDDWRDLCEHVHSMRRAGHDPEMPRVERLVEERAW